MTVYDSIEDIREITEKGCGVYRVFAVGGKGHKSTFVASLKPSRSYT
jgi:hypothetical protein